MKCKRIIGLVLIISVFIGTTVFATVGSRTATLMYDNIKILINGKQATPKDANGNTVEPFTIDGTTYLPVRAIASALGMNVGWDDATKTVKLDNPGVFQGGVQVYDDKYVTIEFAGCTVEKPYEWSEEDYYVNFNITNKTDAELTFDLTTIALDGVSYQINDMEDIAPQSTGKISFSAYDEVLPTSGVSKISGNMRVIDMEETLNAWDYDYTIKWVNVTQK